MKHLLIALLLFTTAGYGQVRSHDIIVGAARMDQYLPLLKNKRVAILTNNTALVNGVHVVDTLLKRHVNIVEIFGPEHGFRGTANAGATVGNFIDQKTGIPVVSLYGKHDKPTPEELKNVDVMVYDIQDVGVRFYTYISTMQRFMEAAAENHKPFIILDRPDPNGFYVDGPVLDKKFKSGVGMQPIPIVYGMTIGEYAKMLIGQHWLSSPDLKPDLTVIKCLHYTHDSLYQLPTKPSPNLPNMASVYLYPSLCFFEGTVCSVGRGTKYPFQLFGHPDFPDSLYTFTPKPEPGATEPKLNGQVCYGYLVATKADEALEKTDHHIQLKWLIRAYQLFPDKDKFFTNYINLLAGTDQLQKGIKEGWSETRIRKSWEPGLRKFEKIRRKYLLYPD
ncbi:MAG: exo-beta-N-acetylmuramidase NamZ family protein, partial [Chitinophagaceae bacterium]